MDSGDLAYLSKIARKMLDDAGFSDAVISASNDLDEYLIENLKSQDAKINSWAVSYTHLIHQPATKPHLSYRFLSAICNALETALPKIKHTIASTSPFTPTNATTNASAFFAPKEVTIP